MDPFKAFYREHKDTLFAYLLRMTGDYQLAADILQESFTRCLERYSARQINAALLFKIAKNALSDVFRKKRPDTAFDENRHRDDRFEHRFLVREQYRRVLAAMQELEVGEREVLALVLNGQFTYGQIANMIQTSEANVKVKVHRARKKLRAILGENDQ